MNILEETRKGSVILRGLSWEEFQEILEELGEHGGARITFDRGTLEIMSPHTSEHEGLKRLIGRLIECFTLEMEIDILSMSALTLQLRSIQRAVEADESYYIASEPRVRGKKRIDLAVDPPPDLAVEIEVSRRVIPRLPIYAALGVREIWAYDGRRVRVLRLGTEGASGAKGATSGKGYTEARESAVLPQLPLAGLARHLELRGTMSETRLVKAFRDWVREKVRKS